MSAVLSLASRAIVGGHPEEQNRRALEKCVDALVQEFKRRTLAIFDGRLALLPEGAPDYTVH
jgi:hypothetical protein